MENKQVELKSCPFCNGEAKLKHGLPRNQKKGVRQTLIQCKKCGCRTPLFIQLPYQAWEEIDEIAVMTWNKRA